MAVYKSNVKSSLETIRVCGAKCQQWHITQGQKFIVVPPGAKLLQVRQERRGSCRVSTDPITIWIMGFRFLFWQGLSISRSCACSPTDAPSVTDIELLSASSSSSFQANKFIHLVLCWLLVHRQVFKKKKKRWWGGGFGGDLWGLPTSGWSGDAVYVGEKGKQGQ